MNLFFWTLLNLGVPIIGPIFTLVLIAPTHGWRVAMALVAGSVKDGQLFWCAIGLCATAIYEAVTALERRGAEVPMLALCIVGFCLGAFSCSIVAMLVCLNGYQDKAAKTMRLRRALVHVISPRRAIALSGASVVIVSISFAILHIHLNQGFTR